MQMLNEKERENALNEIRILASIQDPYIIGFKEAFIDGKNNDLCVIMEFANGGDLQKVIKQHIDKKSYISEKLIWKCLIEVTIALRTLHNGSLKLADLNVSKIAKMGLVYTQTGTPYYASPEVWRDEPYNVKSDIWSLGCVLYEIAALKPPFRGTDLNALFKKVQKGAYDPLPKFCSNDLRTIIGMLLKVNPVERPSSEEILQNEIVRKNGKEVFENLKKDLHSKNDENGLLNTIKIPKEFDLKLLKDKLPKPKYTDLNKSLKDFKIKDEKPKRIFSADLKKLKMNKEKNENKKRNELINVNENDNKYKEYQINLEKINDKYNENKINNNLNHIKHENNEKNEKSDNIIKNEIKEIRDIIEKKLNNHKNDKIEIYDKYKHENNSNKNENNSKNENNINENSSKNENKSTIEKIQNDSKNKKIDNFLENDNYEKNKNIEKNDNYDKIDKNEIIENIHKNEKTYKNNENKRYEEKKPYIFQNISPKGSESNVYINKSRNSTPKILSTRATEENKIYINIRKNSHETNTNNIAHIQNNFDNEKITDSKNVDMIRKYQISGKPITKIKVFQKKDKNEEDIISKYLKENEIKNNFTETQKKRRMEDLMLKYKKLVENPNLRKNSFKDDKEKRIRIIQSAKIKQDNDKITISRNMSNNVKNRKLINENNINQQNLKAENNEEILERIKKEFKNAKPLYQLPNINNKNKDFNRPQSSIIKKNVNTKKSVENNENEIKNNKLISKIPEIKSNILEKPKIYRPQSSIVKKNEILDKNFKENKVENSNRNFSANVQNRKIISPLIYQPSIFESKKNLIEKIDNFEKPIKVIKNSDLKKKKFVENRKITINAVNKNVLGNHY